METVDDVLDGLESGVQHAFQAGIDRVNQNAKTLSHEIKDWRIMPQPFTYAVSIIHFATFYIMRKHECDKEPIFRPRYNRVYI
jgi:hypothetical protein